MKCQHCGADNADDARFCGACGRATSATEPSRAGDHPHAGAAPDFTGRVIAGRYRVLAKLGEGGMGAVYRGEQISLKRPVAIKLLRPELSADAGLLRRFNAEAELVAKLGHPNTVNIYDFGQDVDGTLFIAMELLEGRSLRQAMTGDGPLPAARAIHVAAQIAASIADAHLHGIVHRDLKPDNVMLTARGRDVDVVRVLDFGIAKLRDGDRATVNPMTQAGDLVGTPQYMAPEQIRGEAVDARTDVYALGAIVYEMITGRMPFEGPTVMAILSRHLLDTPEPPARRRPDLTIPPALDALVMEMLAKDPAQRVASMDLVGERLAAIAVEIGAIAPTRPGAPPAVQPPPRMTTRPPGVPQSYPPGAMTPMPPTGAAPPVTSPHGGPPAPPPAHAAPSAHAYPAPAGAPGGPPPAGAPAYAPAYAPPGVAPGHAPYTPAAAPASGGRTWLWVVLAVALATAVVATVVIASRPDGGGSAGAASRPAELDDGDDLDDPDDPGPTPSATGDVVEIGAYELALPVGFIELSGIEQAPGMLSRGFGGTLDGQFVTILTIATDDDASGESKAQLDAGCDELAHNFLGGSRRSSFEVSGRGAQRYRCTIDGGAQVAEAAVYAGPGGSLIVFFMTEPAAFASLEPARAALFDRQVTSSR